MLERSVRSVRHQKRHMTRTSWSLLYHTVLGTSPEKTIQLISHHPRLHRDQLKVLITQQS